MAREDTRDQIINTASELFYNQGYNLTGINEIIDKAGIAKATLYSHFKSKEDLIQAYLDKKDNELLKSIMAFCESKQHGEKRLIAVLEFLVEFFKQDNFNGCWCIRSMAEVPKENAEIRLKIKNSKTRFREYIKLLVRDNMSSLTSRQKEKLSNRLYLLYEASVSESHLQDDVWPIKESISLLKEILKSLR